jgi:diguanylate cyclase (GGDEF)-like protein
MIEPLDPSTASSRRRIWLAPHRLSRRLARVTGREDVSGLIVRSMARAVDARLASFAMPDPEGGQLAIVATHGYPLALTEHLRIAPGVGVLGSVYQSGVPLWVTDVSTFPGLQRRRPRYRTNSFIALPIAAGSDVLGVVSVADRADGQAFTHDNLSALRALAAPAALALARERARVQVDSFAHAAAIDPVSGLFNRRYFQARLEEELQRAWRHRTPVALLMLDIDNFKTINDRFGHLVGDTVIRDVAEILRRSVRVFDVCTRFGGDEFTIVMPNSGQDGAAKIAERIRQRIEAHHPSELASTPISVSVGITVSSDEMSARELIAQADQALYLAKQAGRNQVRTLGRPNSV